MIKINLIPAKRKKKPKPVPQFLLVMIALLLLAGLGAAFSSYYWGEKVATLEAQKRANAKTIAALQQKLKEVKDFEKLNEIFQRRQEVIEQLTKNQRVPVMILDEMSSRLTDGIWLTSMSIAGKKISISGKGFSNTDIVAFVQSLKDSQIFVDANLLGTSKVGGKVSTYKFSITLKYKSPVKPAEGAK